MEQRKNILRYLGFQRFDDSRQAQLQTWLEERATQGVLPEALFQQAEAYLLAQRTLLPGPSVLERLIIHVCSGIHAQLFETIAQRLPPTLQQTIEHLLSVPEGAQRPAFAQLKEYPPAATISSLQTYLARYQTVAASGRRRGNPPPDRNQMPPLVQRGQRRRATPSRDAGSAASALSWVLT